MENSKPSNYTKSSEPIPQTSKATHRKALSKDRTSKNQSYVGVDKRRFNSSQKDKLRAMNSTSYNFPSVTPLTTQNRTEKMFKVEAFNDPESHLANTSILNVVSPPGEKIGFHITDLLDQKKEAKRKLKQSDTEFQSNTSIFDRFRNQDSQDLASAGSFNQSINDKNFTIKNYRILHQGDSTSGKDSKHQKPITAAPMSYNSSGANAIRKITRGTSRKDRLNSTTNVFRNMKSPLRLPVNNSLLSNDEKGQFFDMRPISNYFDQFFEETHYMFPKHKSKFGIRKQNYSVNLPTKYRSVPRSPKGGIIEEVKDEAEANNQEDTKDSTVIAKLREQAAQQTGNSFPYLLS